jgi:quercetin dioxygenase-like cupin family protein
LLPRPTTVPAGRRSVAAVPDDDRRPVCFLINELPWADDNTSGAIPQDMLDEADRRGGGGRKLLAAGEGGFHSSYSVMPAGYAMPLHRHDYEELVVVLDGACRWCDSRVLEARDSVVMSAGTVHGFTCGERGMKLLTIARGPFRTELVDDAG